MTMAQLPVAEARGQAVELASLPPRARVSLRVRAANRAALGAALGVDLPETIGRRAAAGEREVVCLGPDEWLLCGPDGTGPALVAEAAGAGVPHSAVDVSDRDLSWRIEGAGAADLLAIGVARDLDGIRTGRAVRTAYADVSVILWRDGEEAWRIDVWRSFAPHLLALLEAGRSELAAGL
jgi:sarcosine oxidase subunit gamma